MEDGLNLQPDASQFPIPPVSPLLAMGGSYQRFSRRWIVGISVLGAFLLAIILFTLLCSATFFLPQRTILFASASPKTINAHLNPDQKATLPIEWQQTLQKNSRWPVIFGIAGGRSEHQAFILGPRWAIPAPLLQTTDTKTRGLIRQIGLGTSNTEQPLVYRELFFDQLSADGTPNGWINASLLFPNASSSNQIAFSLEEGKLRLSDTAKALTSESQLNSSDETASKPLAADVSLHLSALGRQIDARTLLSELPLDPVQTTLTSLAEPPATLEARFSTSTIDTLRLTFRETLTPAEQAALLSQLNGTHVKTFLTLPDGTIANEQQAIAATSTTPTMVDWHADENGPFLSEAQACASGVWLGRFSPRLLERLADEGSVLGNWIPKQPVQVWREKNQLVVCLES